MKRDAINAIARQMFELYQEREARPERRAPYFIDLAHYTSSQQFEAERRILFRESPLMLGFSVDLPEVGSVKTNDYLDIPILLIRTKSGTVKAFANMCRHRGGRLVDEPTCMGKRKAFTCRYHGWVYGLDGELKGIQQEQLFGNIDKSNHGLIELPCEERHGLIFVRPVPGAAVAMESHLGSDFAVELADWDFGSLHLVDATTIDTRSNWKVQIDTFLESYHVESLHKSTIAPLSLSGYALNQGYGRHQRMVFAASSITQIRDVPPEALDGHKHLTIVYNIFPNILIVYGPLWVQYFEIYPGKTVDTQKTRFALYSRKAPANEEQRQAGRAYFDLNLSFVPTEDYLMGEQATRAVMSGVEKRHLFGHAEETLVHYHRELRSAIGFDPDGLFHTAPDANVR
ncbi:MAG: aromatic ring-hydroxylating dioxygenase subunit alpha [Steroidobacteraceae bacterium]